MGSDGLGFLEIEFNGDNFVINDGQHRCAAIKDAIKENPALRQESISVLLFAYQSKERVQQMFADLNRYVVKANNATGILTDHRDMFARVIRAVCDQVPAFQGLVDKEHQSLPARSEKVFTLYSLYDATKELLADGVSNGSAGFDELVTAAVQYWTTVSTFMPDWAKVRNRELRPIELRQENISTHSVVLRALGGVGAELLRQVTRRLERPLGRPSSGELEQKEPRLGKRLHGCQLSCCEPSGSGCHSKSIHKAQARSSCLRGRAQANRASESAGACCACR